MQLAESKWLIPWRSSNSRQELLGQLVSILVPERFRANHFSLLASYFVEPRSRPMGVGRDLRGLRKDKSEFPVEIGLTPIETAEGMMVLAAILDITQRKRGEAIEKRVRDLQVELLHASRLRTMGQMASTLAHELNQPLAALHSYLEGLRPCAARLGPMLASSTPSRRQRRKPPARVR